MTMCLHQFSWIDGHYVDPAVYNQWTGLVDWTTGLTFLPRNVIFYAVKGRSVRDHVMQVSYNPTGKAFPIMMCFWTMSMHRLNNVGIMEEAVS